MPSIQENLEHFTKSDLDIFECISIVELLAEFKRIKTISMRCHYDGDYELRVWKLKIEQFKNIMKKKHSEIEISIDYLKR